MLTVREIKDILRRERISISKRRGQNFLVDERMKKRITEAVDINPADEVLEIGPGLGALTEDLARQAQRVIAIEKDKALARISQQRLSGYKNLQIIHQDILKTDMGKLARKKLKVVGNLPYYITTPIIGYLLEEQRETAKDVFITVQDEVGRRLIARKNTKNYSAITILVQYFTTPELLFSIPKRAFYPQPKVNSVFMHLRVLDEPAVKVNNQEQFFRIVRACFNQRRKIILNSLAHRLANIEKETIGRLLTEQGINSQARPESLSLDEFAGIEESFYKRGIRVE